MKFGLLTIYIFVHCNTIFADFVLDDTVQSQVTFLEPGTIVDYQPKIRRGFFNNDMRIYCYRGSSKHLTNFFESVELQLEIERDEFTQYEGATPTEVRQHFDERQSLFSFNLFTYKRTKLNLSPFKQQCIGIDTELSYRVCLQQFRVDYFRLIQFGLGISAFLFAGKLSQNSMFYYLTGIILGICCSFMFIIWLCSKLMPRRPLMYGMMIGGWTLGVYIIQCLWENLHLIFQMYRTYVVWYIFITGLLAFFFCYRIGPPQNQRSKNIIKWVLQVMAIILIYFSSQYEEASAVAGVITFVANYFPYYILHKLRTIYRRFFPKQRRLLTNEEYHEQGIIETSKALNELRAYASSPDCKQWKIISKLSDPLRFASFVEGESHVREEELAVFESFRQANENDESDFSEDGDEKIVEKSQSHHFRNTHYCNEQTDINSGQRAMRNVTYEEMSEEEYDNEDNNSSKDVNIGRIEKSGIFSAKIKNENKIARIGIHHNYSPDVGHNGDKTKTLSARKEQQNEEGQQTLLNSKVKFTQKHCVSNNITSKERRYQDELLENKSYYNNGSESDDY